MVFAKYMPYEMGELTDEIYYKDENQRNISIGNVSVIFSKVTKTFVIVTNSDEEWTLQHIDSFRRILDYIEIAYGDGSKAPNAGD